MPLIYTADDARKLAQAAKFPPTGQRGFGSPFAMGQFGALTASEYLQQANDSLVTIVQIETREALENVLIPKRPMFLFRQPNRRADDVMMFARSTRLLKCRVSTFFSWGRMIWVIILDIPS